MNLNQLRREYWNACDRGDLDFLKKVFRSAKFYNYSNFEPAPNNSPSLERAFYKGHIEVVNFLLTSEDVNQDFQIPSSVIQNLKDYNSKVVEYLCKNKEIQSKFNALGNKEHYHSALKAASFSSDKELVKYLVSLPETKQFWQETMNVLYPLFTLKKPSLDVIKVIAEDLLNNQEINKEVLNMILRDCFVSSLCDGHTDITKYFIFDLNLKIGDVDRNAIKEKYPDVEKMLVTRDLNDKLSNELPIVSNTIQKKLKV